MNSYILLLIILPLLIYSTITDIYYRTIPLWFCAVEFVLLVAAHWLLKLGWLLFLSHIVSAAILFCTMLVAALFSGGGGDCILMGLVGLAIGLRRGLIALILSCVLMTLYYFLTGRKKQTYPMAPFVLAGVIIACLI